MSDYWSPLSTLVDPVRDVIVTGKDPSLAYVGLEHLESGTSTVTTVGRSEDSISTNVAFKAGDILFGKLRPNLRKSVLVDFPGYCSTEFIVLRPKLGINASYAGWVMRSKGIFSEAIRTAEGTRMPRTSWSRLRNYSIRRPPHGEQQRIADILDSVDEQIEVSLRLTAKYQDIRTATVRSVLAVALDRFKGREAYELQRRADQRDTGPWSLVPLGSMLLGIDAGNSPDLEDTPAGPEQWGVLKVSAVGSDGFHPEENKVVQNRSLCDLSICVRKGDLLMTRANTSQLVGRSCIVDSTPPGLMLCDKTLRLRVDERNTPTRYVNIALGLPEVRRQIEIAATGTSGSMKNISQHSIKQLMIPLGRQADVHRVTEIDALHDMQIATLRAEVDRLRLVKQGLMDDLLSGRVRVNPGR